MTPKQPQFLSLLFVLLSSVLLQACVAKPPSTIPPPASAYVKLDQLGKPVKPGHPWSCVKHIRTDLLWEVKNQTNKNYTYSWFTDSLKNNGGFSGYPNKGRCPQGCDTRAYVENLRASGYCGSARWRLPSREELRSLVNYGSAGKPAIDLDYFPHTVAQFYWSATPDASNPDSAWGIGFTFGFDYAYFKSDYGHIRLVADP